MTSPVWKFEYPSCNFKIILKLILFTMCLYYISPFTPVRYEILWNLSCRYIAQSTVCNDFCLPPLPPLHQRQLNRYRFVEMCQLHFRLDSDPQMLTPKRQAFINKLNLYEFVLDVKCSRLKDNSFKFRISVNIPTLYTSSPNHIKYDISRSKWT